MRCEWSWLLAKHCAHCLNHRLDPELEAVVQSNIQGGITWTST